MSDPQTRKRRVLAGKNASFEDLIRLAELDPATSFVGQDLRDVDFGDMDLSPFNFSGADLRGAKLDRTSGSPIVEGAAFSKGGESALGQVKSPKQDSPPIRQSTSVNVRVDREFLQRFDALCDRHKSSRSEMIRLLMMNFLKQNSEDLEEEVATNIIEERFPSLSSRQVQVLSLALQGCPNKVIADKLDIAEGTVKTHLSAAFRVIGAKNRTEALYILNAWPLRERT